MFHCTKNDWGILYLPFSDDSILEPLVFDMDAQKPSSAAAEQTKGCILCEQQFEITNNTEDFYRHLLTIHKLVIADCKHIPDLGKWVSYCYVCAGQHDSFIALGSY